MDDDTQSALNSFFASLAPDGGGEDLETDVSNRDVVAEGERPCPICGEKMTSETKRGIMIDVCQEHGVWFDKDELASVLRRSNSDAVKTAMRTAGKSDQDGGFLLGFALGNSL